MARLQLKMLKPQIPPWVKQTDRRIQRKIQTGDIIELVAVAVRTGQREVFQFIGTSVLFRDNVIANKSKLRINRRKVAILTAMAGTASDNLVAPMCHLFTLWRFVNRAEPAISERSKQNPH